MSWTPYFIAQFTKPLIRQLIAIIYRDMPSALALMNPSYASFQEWDLAEQPVINFPALLIIPREVQFDEQQPFNRAQTIQIALGIAVAHQDPNAVAEILQDYVRAVDQVLETSWMSTSSDFSLTTLPLPSPPFAVGTLAPGLPGGTVKEVHIIAHMYDELRQRAQGLFAKAATINLKVMLQET
ncbi:MAG TPA: hypothetical protein VKW70_00090 [Terriglobia bacterium]|nr:hypothetical protein [Terriglobia bacterium]